MSLFGAVAAAQTVAPAPARVVAPVTNAVRSVLPSPLLIAKSAQADLGALDSATPLRSMMLTLQPSDRQDADLTSFLAEVSDPHSPQFHHWLTPAEFGQRFGVADADLQKIVSWLESGGFTVDPIPAGRRTILFSGTAGQFRAAFNAEMHTFRTSSGVQVANLSTPSIPAALAPVIAGFVSLSNKRHQATHHDLGTFAMNRSTGSVSAVQATVPLIESAPGADAARPDFTTTIGTGTTVYHIVTPYDFATIYDLKPLWNSGIDGTGQTIAIVSRSNLNLADVDNFRANFGLPATRVNKIVVGDDPGITSDVAETALDVEWSGAVARNATINLVVGGSSLTSDGTDLSALYIVNNNISPVLSMSYGECEFALGTAGNLFYKTLWEQAAAQGQTVLVSTGDASAATCDQGGSYATLGLTVNGLGSTPYNLAVGGTDLYGTYTSAATTWSATNNPSTLASALTYVPEAAWNDSCGNPLVLGALQAKSGYTDTSTAQLCNNRKINTANFRTLGGGGGGASSCLSTTDGTPVTCTGGYAKPAWQTGAGVPTDGVRDIPDVSLFSGDGLWGSLLPYCVGSLTHAGVCDLTNTTNIQGAGGTSFASPSFAGIIALINQKTQSIQGNANTVLYKLAASQQGTDCTVENATNPGACIFHDIDQAGNAVPCYAYGGAANCAVASTGAIWGVTTGNAAGKNYDLATGLGSVDITNLVNGWQAVAQTLTPTSTSLTLSSQSVVYGSGPQASVSVTGAGGAPTGDFAIETQGITGRSYSDPQGTLSGGKGTLTLTVLPVGTYPVHAHYGGDSNYAGSDSAPQTVTVTLAPTTVQVVASIATVTTVNSTRLAVTVFASGQGADPTGSILVTNTTTGVTLGSYTLQNATSGTAGIVYINVASTQLMGGSNTLSLAYSGDANYASSTGIQTLTFNAPLSITLASSSLTLSAGTDTSSTSTTATIAPANSGTLAYPITLSCVGSLPRGSSCTLSTPVLNSPAVTSTVTVAYNPQLAANHLPSTIGGAPAALYVSFAALLGGLVAGRRRRRHLRGLVLVIAGVAIVLAPLNGCSNSTPAGSVLNLTASSAAVAPATPVTFSAVFVGTGPTAVPSGTVTFNDSFAGTNRTLGSLPLTPQGMAVLNTSSLPIGLHSVTAVYAGDSHYPGATSTAVPVQVSSSTVLQIVAVDANGQQVSAALGVKLQ